jgi:hypothetical protein
MSRTPQVLLSLAISQRISQQSNKNCHFRIATCQRSGMEWRVMSGEG